ncbi:MAG: glutamate mutase L [bacterium]
METSLPDARSRAELLVADIGSTLTKVSAFFGVERGANVRFLGQAAAATTVAEGDVGVGLDRAIAGFDDEGIDVRGAPLLACASAAGGLRMTVHGLTTDMTLRAAREASLGAGARVVLATAGALDADDLAAIARQRPSVILLAGGVDGGERDQVIANARALASLGAFAPVVFAGNRAVRGTVEKIFAESGVNLIVTENVYPSLDRLEMGPARRAIQDLFARHVILAPGMDAVRARLGGDLVPTPAAVLAATELLAAVLGDLVVVDVGGATTDVCSVIDDAPRPPGVVAAAPEPRAKRTVEGDLGVFVSAAGTVAAAPAERFELTALAALPTTPIERVLAKRLTRIAVDEALWRHAGERRTEWGARGAVEVIEGRDLSSARWLVGTGGALTRLDGGAETLAAFRRDPRGRKRLPPEDVRVAIDRHYVMAAAGVMATHHPEAARALVLESLGVSAAVASGARDG